jgi:hypothetical protein
MASFEQEPKRETKNERHDAKHDTKHDVKDDEERKKTLRDIVLQRMVSGDLRPVC